jgi:hypothetical protein
MLPDVIAASETNVQERNDDFHMINTRLTLRKAIKLPATQSQAQGQGAAAAGGAAAAAEELVPVNATDRFERVFWCGDLNYRVFGNRKLIDKLISGNMLGTI